MWVKKEQKRINLSNCMSQLSQRKFEIGYSVCQIFYTNMFLLFRFNLIFDDFFQLCNTETEWEGICFSWLFQCVAMLGQGLLNVQQMYKCTVPNNSYHFWADSLQKWLFLGMADIHEYWSKMPCLPIIFTNFSRGKSHNLFIMEKSKFTLLFNICWNWLIYSI